MVPFSSKFSHEAKLFTVIFAIDKAWHLHLNLVWIECDSIYVICLLQSRGSLVPWCVRKDWERSLNNLDNMQVHISYVFREGNVVANKLSSMTVSLSVASWWDSYPPCCNSLMIHDASGRENFRFS